MSESIIKFDKLSKQYRLGVVGRGTLNEDLKRFWYRIRGKEDPFLMIGERNDRSEVGKSDYVWALRDIDFEVEKGEVLGIIGRNGAGKSTLLKILSKVTGPTTGKVEYNGRIGALLEVGTGFHNELTGRENIFLNGAILGMTKVEIRSKLDEIIEFSGCERYIDTPVKRYSSGMKVRLGFAVAAHLEPEILIVDEVLAVGDVDFQKKAIGKMKDIASEEGRTVLFVSHNMVAIEKLCDRVVLLEDGMIKAIGDTNEMIAMYLSNSGDLRNLSLCDRKDRQGDGEIRFIKIEILQGDVVTDTVRTGQETVFRIYFDKSKCESIVLFACRASLSIAKDERQFVILSSEMVLDRSLKLSEKGYYDFIIEKLPFTDGVYSISLFLQSNGVIKDFLEDAVDFCVEGGDYYGNGKNIPRGWEGRTVLLPFRIED